MDRKAAGELAEQLDLDLDDMAICLACLSFVSTAVDADDEREIRRWTRKMAPDLWAEGLELPARVALRTAAARGVAGAEDAFVDVDAHGPRSVAVLAIVGRLADDLSQRARGDLFEMGWQPWPPPELR